jgi:hypothetical protein
MGMVPIPIISPLTLTRSDEPFLEPPLPISRVENSTEHTGGNSDETYAPSGERSAADAETTQSEPTPDQDSVDTEDPESQPSLTDSSPSHQINLFA